MNSSDRHGENTVHESIGIERSRWYYAGAAFGVLWTALLTSTLHGSDASMSLIPVFVFLGGGLSLSSAMAGSAGEANNLFFGSAGFGVGVMFGPIVYGIGYLLYSTLTVALDMGVI